MARTSFLKKWRGVNNHIQEGSRMVDALILAVIVLICVLTLYPMYYVFIMSISKPQDVMAMNVYLWPTGFEMEAYKKIFTDSNMWRAYANSILYTASSTILILITSVLGAYPLSVPELRGRKFVVAFVLLPMYFGGGLIPTFLVMNSLHLYNNIFAIIIPASFSIWYIILTRTYFTGIPKDIRESAFIDGASDAVILFRIYLPLAKPILAVIAIYSIVSMWNNWFSAQVYLPDQALHPLQLYLKRVLVAQTVDLTKLNSADIGNAMRQMISAIQMQYSMIIFTTLPIIFTYPFFQKYFIKGVMLGSLKG